MRTSHLLFIAYRHIRARRARSLVTIGGIGIAIGATVLLVSFGYGVERSVLDRTVHLEELRHIEVYPQQGTEHQMSSDVLRDLNDIQHVQLVLPLITSVAEITHGDARVDAGVHALPAAYLIESTEELKHGTVFAETERTEHSSLIVEERGIKMEEIVEDEDLLETLREVGMEQLIAEQEHRVTVKNIQGLIAGEAVVNTALLRVLDIPEEEAAGQSFTTRLILTGMLLEDPSARIESTELSYRIVGVSEDEDAPLFYIPLEDIRILGAAHATQAKVIMASEQHVPHARERMESLGFTTFSITDTIEQIERMFSNIRMVLVVVGAVALAVASLGMFNTLTVSLLERTREIGFMKVLGMKSKEVKRLFLFEALLMSCIGGASGIIGGYVAGKIVNVFFYMYTGERISVSFVPFLLILIIMLISVVIGLVTGYYPTRRAKRISALDALRYE